MASRKVDSRNSKMLSYFFFGLYCWILPARNVCAQWTSFYVFVNNCLINNWQIQLRQYTFSFLVPKNPHSTSQKNPKAPTPPPPSFPGLSSFEQFYRHNKNECKINNLHLSTAAMWTHLFTVCLAIVSSDLDEWPCFPPAFLIVLVFTVLLQMNSDWQKFVVMNSNLGKISSLWIP